MKKQFNSPSMSLFDQLGAGLDVVGQIPVPSVHRYAEDADQGEIAPAEVPANPASMLPMSQDLNGMKFTHLLIKHLDMLYGRMIDGELPGSNVGSNEDEITVDIAGMPHIQKNAYYNAGHSSVTEST